MSKAKPDPTVAAAGAALIWCPFPDETAVEDAVAILIGEGLIACANLMPMRSLYIWEGKRTETREVGVLFKTRADLMDRALERLCALHPYEAPSALAWRCDAAAPATLAWLGDLEPTRA